MSEKLMKEMTSLYENYFSFMKNNIIGLDDVIKKLFISLATNNSSILEGPPGIGKTTIIKLFSLYFNLEFSRIQFTPDIMPLDIIGSSILTEDKEQGKTFKFYKGPLFANIVLGDEINRATPKTQSAFLEAMEEKRVTFLGNVYPLPNPFLVFATQNPIELEGTYPLPEAQIDRFLMKINIEYPDNENLRKIIELKEINFQKNIEVEKKNFDHSLFYTLENQVVIVEDLKNLVSKIISFTNPKYTKSDFVKQYILYPASPRAAIGLIRAAKWNALINNRFNVSYEDIKEMSYDILKHRLILNFQGEAQGIEKKNIIDDIFFRLGSYLE